MKAINTATPQLDAAQMTTPGIRCPFGMDRRHTAQTLREIAENIESGEYVLMSGMVFSQAVIADYVISGVVIKFHEKRPETDEPEKYEDGTTVGRDV